MPIYACSQEGALRQGEIVTDLIQVRLVVDATGPDTQERRFAEIDHPFVVILSQDCDLEQDWKARQAAAAGIQEVSQRELPAVLFAQVHKAEDLRGRYEIRSELWKRVRQNKDERFHFLEAVPADAEALAHGLPELGIDFKRYFTIPTLEVYKRIEGRARRRCRLQSPYLEHLSTRFCYYQFRIALPLDHQST